MNIGGYGCLDCDFSIIDKRNLDGKSCPKCKGPMMPIPENQLNKEDGVIRMKPYDRNAMQDKVRYLAELRHMLDTAAHSEERKEIAKRIQTACDSIEKDLGLGVVSGIPLMLDQHPALLFVQEKGGHYAKVYQDGQQLKGVRSITIHAAVGEATTHEVEYITGCTADRSDK
jgi:hypothetical protein